MALSLLAAVATLLAFAPAASATFHLIKVREVYAGQSDDSYVELQMYASGQSFLSGHSMTLYNSAGALVHSSTFSSGVAHSANQQTVLIGDTNVQTAFGVAPDLVDSGLAVPAAGGAACWNAGGVPADCVAWGSFSGGAALQTATGTSAGTPASAAGITAGKALRRKISPGCPTLLEEADDTDNSTADFEEVAPAPRNDNSAIVESICPGVPNTAIDDRPALNSNSADAEFTYEAPSATSYECKLDAAPFASCPAGGPQTYSGLLDGSHTFQVRGVNVSGPDPTPASYTWTVDTVAPSATIDNHPPAFSPGTSVAFTFHASESGSTFECSLAKEGAADAFSVCSSGKTYSKLADGEYAFKVRAIDKAGNTGSPTTLAWTVDNSLNDTTPPETTIVSTPPQSSDSASASFGYAANEPDSSFECKLDEAAFAGCPAGGISYSGLGNGTHSFQVRAIDPSGNVDATPAGYTFDVALPVISSPPPAIAPPPPPAAPPLATPPRKRRHRHRHHRRRHRHKHKHHRHPRSAATASTFHLMRIREVYPGSVANPAAEYVELQMFESGQNFVGGHVLRTYDAAGSLVKANTLAADVPNGGNQRTVLLSTPEAEAQFGVQGDEALSPSGQLDPAGGAVCWESLDCVSWGSFSGPLPSASGSPADPGGIPDGMALRRSIAPRCPTLLEEADDSDNSFADFADAFPAPRSNSATPSEHPCSLQAATGSPYPEEAPGGAGQGQRQVQTAIRRHPPRRSHDRTPTFGFSSSARGSTFLCKLDRGPFKPCRSPLTSRRLGLGPHVFKVKARAPGGAADPSPATYRFRIVQSA